MKKQGINYEKGRNEATNGLMMHPLKRSKTTKGQKCLKNLIIEVLVDNEPPKGGAPLARCPHTSKHCARYNLRISS